MYIPRFTISHQILHNIGIIEASREVIDHAPLIPAYERKFQEEAMVRSVHHGTHIEGNELNISQAEQVLLGQEVTGRQRDIQEVLNYRRVIEYIGQEEKDKEVEDALIKRLHKLTVYKILPPTLAGVYRKTQVVVKNNQTGEITFRPPFAAVVNRQMKDFIAWLNHYEKKDIHPVLRAGIIHYEMARVHPFLDGNGRVARALSMLVLFRDGYDIRRFFSLEEYFDSDPQNYYSALQSVEKKKGDLTEWLEYFTQGLSIELSKIKEKIQKLSIDGALKEKLGGQVALSERQIKIIEYIQQIGFLQNQAFSSLFPFVSEDTILRELKDLMKKKIIKKQGKTKAARYVMR